MKTPARRIKRTYSLVTNRAGKTNVRYSRMTTREDREDEFLRWDRKMRKEVPFTKWKKRAIKKTFTPEYIADLVQRARKNARTSLAVVRAL